MEKLRRLLTLAFLALAFGLSLLAFLEKVSPQGEGFDLCTSEACRVVQFSGFSELMGVPITLVAACLLGLVLLLFLLGRGGVDLILAFLLGAESYLTFIEFLYLGGKCPLCIAFLASLALAFALCPKDSPRSWILGLGGLGFLGLHFLFFYPDADLRPLPSLDPKGRVVEVFLEPGQEPLVEDLRVHLPPRVQVVKRYVAQRVPRAMALDAIAREAFRYPTGTARRLAERALRRNEEELRRLGDGPLPLFVLREGGRPLALSRGGWEGLLPHLREEPPIFLQP